MHIRKMGTCLRPETRVAALSSMLAERSFRAALKHQGALENDRAWFPVSGGEIAVLSWGGMTPPRQPRKMKALVPAWSINQWPETSPRAHAVPDISSCGCATGLPYVCLSNHRAISQLMHGMYSDSENDLLSISWRVLRHIIFTWRHSFSADKWAHNISIEW